MSSRDSFEDHFARPDESSLGAALSAIKADEWTSTTTMTEDSLGKLVTQFPDTKSQPTLKRKRSLDSVSSIRDLGSIKKRLVDTAIKVIPKFTPHSSVLAVPIFDYQDVLYAARTPQNADELRKIATLHALNHVYKTRDKVLKNSEKLRSSEQQHDPASSTPTDIQDQGFTRPKVLVLLETRAAAAKFVDVIVRLAEPAQQENRKRFENEFSAADAEPLPDPSMPEDFNELFAGNDDNHFIATLKFTRKTVKFYSGFYDSDIILASPVGLRRAITKNPKKLDADFLSSIEILTIDQADAMLMQNFEHVRFVLEHLNRLPRDSSRTDWARVRPYYLDGAHQHLRQTLLFSAYLTPELNNIFNRRMLNAAGRVKFSPATYTGSMLTALSAQNDEPPRQIFTRFAAPTHIADPDARFEYFTSALLPILHRLDAPSSGGLGILIFVPNYFDFVRVRYHLRSTPDALPCEFAALDEYDDVAATRRARSLFVAGRVGCLLYSGRAHHFRRYAIKGVKRAVFYGVPENAAFYAEVLRMVDKTIERGRVLRYEAWVRVLFSRWESMALERVVGTTRVRKMIRENGADTFEFR